MVAIGVVYFAAMTRKSEDSEKRGYRGWFWVLFEVSPDQADRGSLVSKIQVIEQACSIRYLELKMPETVRERCMEHETCLSQCGLSESKAVQRVDHEQLQGACSPRLEGRFCHWSAVASEQPQVVKRLAMLTKIQEVESIVW